MDLGTTHVGDANKMPPRQQSSLSFDSSAMSAAQLAKILEINVAIEKKDVEALGSLAMSEGGLLVDSIRRQAWPLLLGTASQHDRTEAHSKRDSWRSLPTHRDEGQVQLDVDRSFIFYPKDRSSNGLSKRKEELSALITEVLRRHPYLCYFQGYHDICQVFLLVLGKEDRADIVARLTVLRIRDFLLPTLAPALDQLRLIPSILYNVEPRLCHHLSQTQPFFALSGTLTMYAHEIQEYGDIARLFDAFLAREAVFSVYMFAQIVLQRKSELFETPTDEPEMLHSILSKLPHPLDIEDLIKATVKLFEKHPPEKLKRWRTISRYSVLKTARCPIETTTQTLESGELYFNFQVSELQWAERRNHALRVAWKHRRSVGTIGLAVFVGVLSYWLRRSTGPLGYASTLWRWASLSA